MSEKLVIAGYSGHARVIVDAALADGMNIVGFFDKSSPSDNPYHLQYLGLESPELIKSLATDHVFIVGIGDNETRTLVAGLIKQHGGNLFTVKHPSAIVSRKVRTGVGCFLGPGVIINPQSVIGDNVILNSGSIIEHDCIVGDHTHIAPGAVLTGNVIVGKRTLVGANATILPGIKIGHNVVIGAGSVVNIDLPDNTVWAGNPVREINK